VVVRPPPKAPGAARPQKGAPRAAPDANSALAALATAPGHVHPGMRVDLLGIHNERLRFRGTVVRFGKTHGRKAWKKTTLLIRNVEACDGARLDGGRAYRTDHIWMIVGKQLEQHALRPGAAIEFDARVRWYRKAGGWDLRLSHHTRISLEQRGPSGVVPSSSVGGGVLGATARGRPDRAVAGVGPKRRRASLAHPRKLRRVGPAKRPA